MGDVSNLLVCCRPFPKGWPGSFYTCENGREKGSRARMERLHAVWQSRHKGKRSHRCHLGFSQASEDGASTIVSDRDMLARSDSLKAALARSTPLTIGSGERRRRLLASAKRAGAKSI